MDREFSHCESSICKYDSQFNNGMYADHFRFGRRQLICHHAGETDRGQRRNEGFKIPKTADKEAQETFLVGIMPMCLPEYRE